LLPDKPKHTLICCRAPSPIQGAFRGLFAIFVAFFGQAQVPFSFAGLFDSFPMFADNGADGSFFFPELRDSHRLFFFLGDALREHGPTVLIPFPRQPKLLIPSGLAPCSRPDSFCSAIPTRLLMFIREPLIPFFNISAESFFGDWPPDPPLPQNTLLVPLLNPALPNSPLCFYVFSPPTMKMLDDVLF